MATVTLPAALANKILFVLCLLLVPLASLASAGGVRIRTLSPVIVLVIFVYGYALSFLGDTDRELTRQFILAVSVLLLIYLIEWYGIDFERIVKASGIVLCLFTGVFYYAIIVTPDSTLGAYFSDHFLEYSLVATGERANLADDPLFMFRVGTAPFLFLPFCLFVISFLRERRVRDAVALLIIAATIAVSTSRALILGCLIATGYLVMSRLRPSRQMVLLCVAAAAGLLVAQYLITQTTLFSLTEESNAVKVGHAVSFAEHMTIRGMLFGDGLASYYYSIGRNAVLAHTEITLLDLIRYFGFPLTAVLYAALLFPSLRRDSYRGERRTCVFLFVLYLAMSLTNPVLLNSFGLLIVLWYWSRILGSAAPQAGVAA